jgi:hypothetical protein
MSLGETISLGGLDLAWADTLGATYISEKRCLWRQMSVNLSDVKLQTESDIASMDFFIGNISELAQGQHAKLKTCRVRI